MKKKTAASAKASGATVGVNRKARFDVQVERTFEAGLQLTGDEIKSVRAGRLQLNGGYVRIMGGGKGALPRLVLVGSHLSAAHEPERTRTLLLHAAEIRDIQEMVENRGWTAVPLDLHLKRGWAKLLVGVGRGRKQHDKRQLLRERDIAREAEASIKRR